MLTIAQVTSTQKVASDSQIEKMEKELAKMRAGLDESVQLMEQREMNTNIESVFTQSTSYVFPLANTVIKIRTVDSSRQYAA